MFRAAVLTVIVLTLTSCHPTPRTPPRTGAVVPPAVVPGPLPAARGFDETLLTGKEFLLEASSSSPPVFALDRDLGPLASDEPAVRFAQRFFDVIRSNGDTDTYSDPQWMTYLQSTVADWRQAGWTTVDAWGRPQKDPSGFWNITFRGHTQRVFYQGWVTLRESDAHWLVTDLQATQTSEPPEEFDPEAPPQEISSPNRR